MLQMKTMPLGAYQTNCYLVWDSDCDTCAVIDPGFDGQTVLLAARRLGKQIEAILLTHGHFDHVGAVRDLVADTDCKVYLCEADLSMPAQLTAGALYYTDLYGEGDCIQVAGLTVHVLHTPGHTPGSVCLCIEDHLFSGDTLFAGSCGRTDLPGGDWMTICESLKRLSQLEGNWTVHPGHGESTALDAERKYNPYMREYI